MFAFSFQAKRDLTHPKDDEPLLILLYRIMLTGQDTLINLKSDVDRQGY